MIDTGLKNKVVIVTGANHGIGAATAISFAREGAKVFINYLRQSPSLYGETEESSQKAVSPGRAYYCKQISQDADVVLQKIQEFGGHCHAWEADLSDPQNIRKLFDLTEKKYGRVDILVNNAAYDTPDTFLPESELQKNPLFVDEYAINPITQSSYDNHFAVNSRAVALMMAEFAKRHIEKEVKCGKIINITN